MPQSDEDMRWQRAAAWPGPVGWWYLPAIWLVIVLIAALAWSFN